MTGGVINRSNETSLGWAFRYRGKRRVWMLYRMTNLSSRNVGPEFQKKADAREWAIARSALLREKYAEYKPTPKPPPRTATESAHARIHLLDHCAKTSIQMGDLAAAVRQRMESSLACLAAIPLMPDQREHLMRCAAGRRESAARLFAKWKKQQDEAAAPPPRPLRIVR